MKLPRVGSTVYFPPVFLVVEHHSCSGDGIPYFIGSERGEVELYFIYPSIDEYTVLDIKTYYSRF